MSAPPPTSPSEAQARAERLGRLGKRAVRNALFNLGGLVISVVLGFLLIPFILHHLGPEGYGIWAVLAAVTAWVGLADFGMSPAVSRAAAVATGQETPGALGTVMLQALPFFFAIALLTVLLIGLAAPLLVEVFLPLSEGRPRLVRVLWLMGIASGVAFAGSAYRAVLEGLQRMDVTTSLHVLALGFGALLTVLLLERGLGLTGLVIAQLCGVVAEVIATAVAVARLAPEAPLIPTRWRGLDRDLWRFSAGAFVIQLASFIHRQVDKLILGGWGLARAAGFYDIGAEQVHRASMVPRSLLAGVLPAAAELSAREQPEEKLAFYHRSLRYLALGAAPVAALLVVFGPAFVELWLGTPYRVVGAVVPPLAMAAFVNVMTGPGVLVDMGYGRVRPAAIAAAGAAGSNLLLSVLLVRWYGLGGVVAATVLSTSAWGLGLIVHHAVAFGGRLRALLRAGLTPLILALAVAVLLHWVRQPDDWLTLIGQVVIALLLYGATVMLAGLIDPVEVRFLLTVRRPGTRAERKEP